MVSSSRMVMLMSTEENKLVYFYPFPVLDKTTIKGLKNVELVKFDPERFLSENE